VKTALLSIALLSCQILMGCSGGGSSNAGGNQPPAVSLVSLAVTTAAPSLAPGATFQFIATGTFSDHSTEDLTAQVTWSSSSTAVATISSSAGTQGLVTAVGPGTSTITAKSNSITGTTTLTVTNPLVSIAVTPASRSIAMSTTAQFTAIGTFSDHSTKNLTLQVSWGSSAGAVATISNTAGTSGLAKAVGAGSTTISATSGNIVGTATLTVTNATITSIVVTPANPTIDVGTQQQFTATGNFSDGTAQDISNIAAWSSSVSNIAVITTSSGLATGKNQGTSTITATFASVSGNTTLTVSLANLVSVAIKPVNPTIAQSTSLSLAVTGTFTDGSTRTLTAQVSSWTSSVPAVATMSGNRANGLTPGQTTITANIGSVSGSTTLTVTNATLVSLAVAPSGASLQPAAKLTFTAVGTFSDASTQDLSSQVVWASDNTAAGTVNSLGTVTGVASGTANISATMLTKTGSAPLTVTSATLTSIAITGNPFTAPGAVVHYIATGSYSDGSTQNITQAVTWSSSDSTVASVNSNGFATGQGTGSVTITATQGSVSGTTGLVVTSSQLVSIAVSSPNPGSKLAEQTSVQLKAVGTFADGTTQNLTTSATWTSSDATVATVSSTTGIATGVAPGTVTVRAVFGSVPAGTITLNTTNASLTSVSVSPSSVGIPLGNNQQFNAIGSFNDGTTQNLSIFAQWSSSNANVAVVSSSGLATSSGVGTTTITATASQNNTAVSGTAILTVH